MPMMKRQRGTGCQRGDTRPRPARIPVEQYGRQAPSARIFLPGTSRPAAASTAVGGKPGRPAAHARARFSVAFQQLFDIYRCVIRGLRSFFIPSIILPSLARKFLFAAYQ